MGIGKIFAGISIIAIWGVVVYGIIENNDVLSTFITSPAQRQAFLTEFNAVQPVLWFVVMILGLGVIFWGLKD